MGFQKLDPTQGPIAQPKLADKYDLPDIRDDATDRCNEEYFNPFLERLRAMKDFYGSPELQELLDILREREGGVEGGEQGQGQYRWQNF